MLGRAAAAAAGEQKAGSVECVIDTIEVRGLSQLPQKQLQMGNGPFSAKQTFSSNSSSSSRVVSGTLESSSEEGKGSFSLTIFCTWGLGTIMVLETAF